MRQSAATLATALLFTTLNEARSADEYDIDPGHAAAVFRINHQGFSYTYGRFSKISGVFTNNNDDPGKGSISVEIQAESINTDLDKRDQHLRGPDFLNSKQFPTLTFKSTAVKKAGDNKLSVTGDFTLHGVTKSITVDVDKVGEGPAHQGQYRAGFETTFKINRSDYGITYGLQKGGVGDEVTIMLSFEGIRK
ncbi:MAG: YceI family protein [Planctomycetota bacterium]|nr:YceI family protein [Planctomycetota bacterium]